jgi:hypothetical protein
MGGTWVTALRVAIGIGVALLLWSVTSSMERITTALIQLADAPDPKGRRQPPDDRPPTGPA